jgi:hypothetical protein
VRVCSLEDSELCRLVDEVDPLMVLGSCPLVSIVGCAYWPPNFGGPGIGMPLGGPGDKDAPHNSLLFLI